MDREKVLEQWMNDNRKCLPQDKHDFVKEQFEKMNDVSFQIAISQKLKSSGVAFALALFLPGFDRFYLGSIGMGILQILLLNALTLGILPLIHLFTVWSETRKVNFEALMKVIKNAL